MVSVRIEETTLMFLADLRHVERGQCMTVRL